MREFDCILSINAVNKLDILEENIVWLNFT